MTEENLKILAEKVNAYMRKRSPHCIDYSPKWHLSMIVTFCRGISDEEKTELFNSIELPYEIGEEIIELSGIKRTVETDCVLCHSQDER